MSRMFGTDGVRGIANSELTPELAFKLGQAGAMALTADTDRPTILIGKDTRISGDMLEAALAAGVCSVGGDAVLLGVVPTPAVAYLTREYKADAGVVISASHNPVEYNGIKFFNCEGYKLPDETEDKIEAYIQGETGEIPRAIGGDVGRITYKMDAVEDYKAFAASTVSESFKGLKVAIDCANGASSCTAKDVLERLGAEVSVIHNNPDGTNINAGCGSTHIESLIDFVKETGADLGLAFDGDADRVLAIDENGELVDGDKIMSICGLDMRERGVLKDDTIVATVMSNLGLHIMAEKNGLKIEQTTVGDRYVLEKMIECDYKLGGEQSGHIILTDFNTTGDGLVTGLQLASVLVRSGKKLSELASVMRVMPQVLINARVQGDKQAYKQDAEIMSMISEIEKEFGGEGRVLIRPSGTEPLVRVMLEGNDIDRITERAKALVDLIQTKLG